MFVLDGSICMESGVALCIVELWGNNEKSETTGEKREQAEMETTSF